MNHRHLARAVLVGLFALGLAACGTPATGGAEATPTTPTPTPASPTAMPTATAAVQAAPDAEAGVSGIGVVKPAQDANLTFAVQGTVDKVLVKEGDVVTQGQLLAILDVRTFDDQVSAAEAALVIAQAQAAALTEAPRAADVRAAQAQVRLAQIALAQTRTSQTEGGRSAQAGVDTAQSNLQSTRERLSAGKTQAEAQL